MKRQVELVKLSIDIATRRRDFVATVDGIEIKGTVELVQSPKHTLLETYRLRIQGHIATKHPDYKDIRRQLLKEMSLENPRVTATDGWYD